MARTYTVRFNNVSVSAVQDAIACYSGASMAIKLRGCGLSPSNTTVENLQVNVKVLPATVTAGSVGSAATPVKSMGTDAAATFTARINDTTQATTSGTARFERSDGYNEVNGLEWWWPKGNEPYAGLSEAIILEIATAPAGARTMSGWAIVEEAF